jgi:glycine/D-amino acid oxidase-like deaminating enzyme
MAGLSATTISGQGAGARDRTAGTVIIGGGIQGLTAALALAERGRRVTVLERQEAPFAAASLRNEGKIHLGFVYALDRSGTTVEAMVEGALTFSPLLERWCGPVAWKAAQSRPFIYAMLEGSLSGPDELENHYERVSREIDRRTGDLGSNYLGTDPREPVIHHAGPVPCLSDGWSETWFETPERSADPRILAEAVVSAVSGSSLIEVETGCYVEDARRSGYGFELRIISREGRWILGCERVVNCTWEDRERLDGRVGVSRPDQCYRVKHQVLVSGIDPNDLVPLTFVQGPFGDVVPWPNGDVYISWYPVTRTYFGSRPETDPAHDPTVGAGTLTALSEMIPGLEGASVVRCAPCHIVAEARTDIEDETSGLHRRRRAGIEGVDGWWSLSGGKLTNAPLASERCAMAITETDPVP